MLAMRFLKQSLKLVVSFQTFVNDHAGAPRYVDQIDPNAYSL